MNDYLRIFGKNKIMYDNYVSEEVVNDENYFAMIDMYNQWQNQIILEELNENEVLLKF